MDTKELRDLAKYRVENALLSWKANRDKESAHEKAEEIVAKILEGEFGYRIITLA